jgi:hypothetical protein
MPPRGKRYGERDDDNAQDERSANARKRAEEETLPTKAERRPDRDTDRSADIEREQQDRRAQQEQQRARRQADIAANQKQTESIGRSLWTVHRLVERMPRDQVSDDLYRLDEQIVRYLEKHGPAAPPAPPMPELEKGT